MGEKMNTRKLLVSVTMLVSVLFSACQAQATPVPTANPLGKHVIAEWNIPVPNDVAFGFDSVWVPSNGDSPSGPMPQTTTRIDPVTNQIIAVINGTGSRAREAVLTNDAVWVTNYADLSKIDPKTNTVVARIAGGHLLAAYGFDSIWGETWDYNSALDRIDPVTAKVVATIQLGGSPINYCGQTGAPLNVTATAVWDDHCGEGELIKIDPATNSIVSRILYSKLIDQAKAQTGVPVGKATNFIWLVRPDPANPQGCGLLQIDPETATGARFISVGGDCNPVAVTENSVWLSGSSQIERFNPTTDQIEATYKFQPGISNLKIGLGSIWLLYWPINLVQRLDIAP
jgi:hypothetical protein